MAKSRILIVEDDGIIGKHIEQVLMNSGYEVIDLVASGEEALVVMSGCLPDMVLMDVSLSGELDGVDTTARILSRWNIPVIYLTAFADEQFLSRARVTRPYAYIYKPFDEMSLLTTIETVFNRRRETDQLRESMGIFQAEAAAGYEQFRLARVLCDTALSLHGSLEIDVIMDSILLNLERILRFDTAVVTLTGSEGIGAGCQRLIHRGARDLVGTSSQRTVMPENYIDQLSASGGVLIIPETSRLDGWNNPAGWEWVRSYAAIPLMIQGRQTGLIELFSADASCFLDAQRICLQVYGTHASLALHNGCKFAEKLDRSEQATAAERCSQVAP
jgi:DNA-binding response OmpR family regulator